MSDDRRDHETGVWFIYDGECPLCASTAMAFRLRKRFGEIHLIDARTNDDHPLLLEVHRRGLDLDLGMVIVVDGKFLHGRDALIFMGQHGDPEQSFTARLIQPFRFKAAAIVGYPLMRAVRNMLIGLKCSGPLRNLNKRHDD